MNINYKTLFILFRIKRSFSIRLQRNCIIIAIKIKDKITVSHSIIGEAKNHKAILTAAAKKPYLAIYLVNLYLYIAIEGSMKTKKETIKKFIAQKI